VSSNLDLSLSTSLSNLDFQKPPCTEWITFASTIEHTRVYTSFTTKRRSLSDCAIQSKTLSIQRYSCGLVHTLLQGTLLLLSMIIAREDLYFSYTVATPYLIMDYPTYPVSQTLLRLLVVYRRASIVHIVPRFRTLRFPTVDILMPLFSSYCMYHSTLDPLPYLSPVDRPLWTSSVVYKEPSLGIWALSPPLVAILGVD